MKGTWLYTTLERAHKEKSPIPPIVTRISKKIDDIPTQVEWGLDLDSTIVHVERVIGYWSHTFKPAERRYSTTEREALGMKEGLVKFQAIIEGEKIICITDHAALTAWNEAYIMLVSCIDYALDMTCIQSVSQCFIVGGIL